MKKILSFLLTFIIPSIYLLVLLTIYATPTTFPAELRPLISYLSHPIGRWTGLIIATTGIGLWITSYYYLRHHFGVLPQKQTYIHTGPYKYFNHPMYWAIFLTFAGLSITYLSVPGFLINLLFLTPINIIRAYKETSNPIPNALLLTLLIIPLALLRLWQLQTVPISYAIDEVDTGYQVLSLRDTGKDYFGNAWPIHFKSFPEKRAAIPIYTTTILSLLPGITIHHAIRLNIALFSILGLIYTYLFTNSITRSSKPYPGLIAMTILGITPWHLTFSRTGYEVAMYYTVFIAGLYYYTTYLSIKKYHHLIISTVLFAITPMIYSTAKLNVLLTPLLLAPLTTWEKTKYKFLPPLPTLPALPALFVILIIPLSLLLLNGGASTRFQELSIFTDPVTAPQVNQLRQLSLGPNPPIGSSPQLIDKIANNKLTYEFNRLTHNLLQPLSLEFLTISGDPNIRHSPKPFGMLYPTTALLAFLGFILLISPLIHKQAKSHYQIPLFIILWILISILPSALTRDGGNHAIRLFLLLGPLTYLTTIAIQWLWKTTRITTIIIGLFILFETFQFTHYYFRIYPILSEQNWYAGMQQLIQSTQKQPKDHNIILDPRYEPPLIFYAYYSQFPPHQFQHILQTNTQTTQLPSSADIEGYRFGNTSIIIGFPNNRNSLDISSINPATYYLYAAHISSYEVPSDTHTISLPSGQPLYYIISK